MFVVLERLRPAAVALALAALLGACDEPTEIPPPSGGGGGGGGTLTITATSPANAATAAEFSSPVTATPSIALRASSATVTSVVLALEPAGTEVPRAIVVSNGGMLLDMSAALVPATTYRGTLGSTLQATTGSMLGTPYTWTFTTRPFQAFSLAAASGGYAGDLGLARDNTGGLHAVYADSVAGDLFYVTCPSNCSVAASWRLVALDTLGNIGSSSSITVGSDNRVHITYRDDRQTLPRLRYATCQAPCADLTSFRFATIDQSSLGVGIHPSIMVGQDGSVNITYYDFVSAFLRYAECDATDCALDSNWNVGTIDNGPFVGSSSSLVVNSAGLRQVAYSDSLNGRLRYAVCATSCTAVNAWVLSQISSADQGQEPALALGNDGTLFVTYYARATGDLMYGECTTTCEVPANWTLTPLATAGLVGQASQVSVNARNRRQVIFADDGTTTLRYGTCVGTCTQANRWRFGEVQANAGAVRSPVMVTRPDNSLQVMYLANAGAEVRYAE